MSRAPYDVIDPATGKVRVLSHRCICGCGQETAIAPYSKADRGWIKGEPMPRIPRHRTPAPIRNEETGCLEWQGRFDENGYPRRGDKWAHRVAYEAAVGPIPDGYDVDHICRNPPCVEPTHLEAVPPSVNHERRLEANRRGCCPKGHELTGDNIAHISTRPNARPCCQCKRERDRARKRDKRSAA